MPLLALMLLVLVLIFVNGIGLLNKATEYSDADIDNQTWVVAQLEVDGKELRLVLLQARLKLFSTAEGDRAVRRAFDIYYSRTLAVAVVLHSESAKLIDPEYWKRLTISRDAMATLIDRTAQLGSHEIQMLAEINYQDLTDMRKIASASVQMFTQAAEAQRMEHRNNLLQLGILMAVLFALMAVAVVLAYRISRLAAFRAQSATLTAANLRRIFEASLDGVLVADEVGNIIYLNAAALSLFDQDTSNLIGAPMADFIFRQTPFGPEKNAHGDMTVSKQPFRISGTERSRLTGLRRSGQEFPVEVSIIPDKDSDGRPVFIGFLRDITIDVEAETRLRKSRDRAEFDASEKSRFLATMSHEMRTPLHGILAALDLINTDNLSDIDWHFLNTAIACAVSALDQVDEVLEATRVGAAEMTISAFEPRKLVADLLDNLRPIAAKRGNSLLLSLHETDSCAAVLGWRRGFLLVMRNLVSNAVKFTRDGRIVVSMNFVDSTDGRMALDVEVRDSGIGIDPADQGRIFREFETLYIEDAEGPGGVGLGLAITRSALELMDSKISVQSTLGSGSCFSFRLMLQLADADSPAKPADLLLLEDYGTEIHNDSRRVLVVDDNPVNLTLMVAMLRRLGHRPETALDGPTAIALARSGAFDLILMDVSMPGMDGLAATRAIRAGGASALCPIVGVTALLLEERRSDILQAGMQDILSKPLRLAQLRVYLGDFFADHVEYEGEEETDGFEEACGLLGDIVMVRLVEHVILDAQAALTVLRNSLGTKAPQEILHRAAGSAAVVGAFVLADALRKGELNVLAGDAEAVMQSTAEIIAGLNYTLNFAQRRWPARSWVVNF